MAQKLIEDAEKLSELMASAHRTALKIEGGEGSAGMLVNDPRLYNNLMDAASQLEKLLGEFRELVEGWKAGGLQLDI